MYKIVQLYIYIYIYIYIKYGAKWVVLGLLGIIGNLENKYYNNF
ncbi:hypothetical protein ACMBCM_08590 [Spiroplasma sp. K1]